MQTIEDRITKDLADLTKQVEAAGLAIHHPSIPAKIGKLLEQFNLTAAAAKGPLTIAQVDDALEHQKLTNADRMAIKLRLSACRVIR